MSRICVAGSGAWGRALAHVAQKAGHEVSIWRRGDARPVGHDVVVLAVPAQSIREVATLLAPSQIPVIIAAKGIERGSGKLMAEVLADVAPQALPFVLSGPSFSADVLNGLPTAVVMAGGSAAQAGEMAALLARPHFRIYQSGDLRGVELGGAIKNVLAIACGISDGKGFGESARAALITRGFAEMVRFGVARGGKLETLAGLSGLGDLMLTCASGKSRNHAFGVAIGSGLSSQQALAQAHGVVEGAATAGIAARLAQQQNINMPIISAVHSIVDGGADPDMIIKGLLARPASTEFT